MSTTAILSFGQRMSGAMRLDPRTYEDVESDCRATWQALTLVLLASLAAGVGFPPFGDRWLIAVASQSAAALLAWFVWAALIYFLGIHVFPEPQTKSSIGELLRTTGFSTAPGLLLALGVVPVLGRPLLAVIAVWLAATMLTAVKQALDYASIWRALAVCGAAWLLAFQFLLILGIAFAPPVF